MRYFLDTEFNGMGGDLISLALVSEDGKREFYAAIPCYNPIPWVAENVMPLVASPNAIPVLCDKTKIGEFMWHFLKNDYYATIVADWPDDIAYFCKALIIGPGLMINLQSLKFEMIRVDAYPTDLSGAIQHNALWDARALRRKIGG